MTRKIHVILTVLFVLSSVTAFPKAAPLILEPIMAVEVNIPQEFQVSCFSILFILLSAFRFSLPLLSLLVAREGHALHACKVHSPRTTSGEINLLICL